MAKKNLLLQFVMGRNNILTGLYQEPIHYPRSDLAKKISHPGDMMFDQNPNPGDIRDSQIPNSRGLPDPLHSGLTLIGALLELFVVNFKYII